MAEDKEGIFREVQRLCGPWSPRNRRAIIAGAIALASIFLAFAALSALSGRFLPAQDILGWLGWGIGGGAPARCAFLFGFLYLVVLLAVTVELTTEVCADGLRLRFFPFHLSFRRIRLDDVARCDAVTYRPILQYGGWGIRWTWKGRAYNVSGNRGVRIDYADGTHLLIGSQRPDELAHAIRSLMEHTAPD